MRSASFERLRRVEVCLNTGGSFPSPRFKSIAFASRVCCASLLFALSLWSPTILKARQSGTQPAPGTPSQAPAAAPPSQAPDSTSSQKQSVTQPATPAPVGVTPAQPLSVEVYYWLSTASPVLRGGAANYATTLAGLDLNGNVHNVPGVIIGIPAGRGNVLNISYFQNVGVGNQTAQTDLTLFGTGFVPGDYLATQYRLQNVKASWDFLSWPTPLNDSSFRFRTLWEVQYTTVYSSIDAPLKPVSYDSSGNQISNTGYGTRWFISPTIGAAVDKTYLKRLRLEAKASGFAIPHHSVIWDAEASATLHIGSLDLIGAYKGFHYKTSPQSDQYLVQTLSGAYVALRWDFGMKL